MCPSACTLKEHWAAMEREADKIGGGEEQEAVRTQAQ